MSLNYDPYDVTTLVISAISNLIKTIPENILLCPDWEVVKKGQVGFVEKKLRLAWSLEFERATRSGRTMNTTNLYSGICSKKEYFNIISNSYKLSFIMRPFPEFELQLEDIMRTLTEDMMKIAEAPIKTKDGKFDKNIVAAKFALWKDVTDRRKGQAAQKVLRANIQIPANKDVTPEAIADLDRRLAELTANEVIQISNHHNGETDET